MSAQTSDNQSTLYGQRRRRVRNYLLDRNLQLRYTLVIVLTSATLTAGLGYFWYSEMRAASRMIEVQKLETLSVDQVDEIGDSLEAEDHKRLVILVGFGLLMAMVLTGLGIVFTHKIAGPLFKIQQHMRHIRHGRLVPLYELRKGDQLRAFFRQFRLMHEALSEQARHEVRIIEQALQELDPDGTSGAESGEQSSEPVARLEALLQRKREFLRDVEHGSRSA
jgi:sensor histidine kinase YesM